jgi:hypothetical protein
MKRLGVVTTLLMSGSLVFAAPVVAAAPTNDTYAGRTVIGSVPFSESVDTTEATTDADDAVPGCTPPATDASVWYELTAATDGGLVVDVSTSTYSAGVTVATGSPGSFSIVTCGPGAVGFSAVAGETYAIVVFDFQEDGSGNGGTLNITVAEIPPPPVVDITVNPSGQFNSKTGSATISGTVTCTGAADFAFLEAQLRQRVGRFIISGFGQTEFVCDGTTQPWSLEVFADNGVFKGGRAVSVTFAFACGTFGCGEDFEERIVQLRR